VWFVDLTAAVPDPETVLATVVSALGVTGASERPGDALRAFLRTRRILLVLDNCEHVLDAVAELVDDWFREPGPLAVLATSREPLDLDGEQVRPLGPLPLTGEGDVTASPAVALLLDRLSAAGADTHDLGLLTHAVRIAAAVNGVPLALELAAARVRSAWRRSRTR
jgi:predicted ATPase